MLRFIPMGPENAPMPPPHPYLVFLEVMVPIAAVLIGMFVLFKRARRETCAWPRWLRLVAQGPGWFLVAWGAFSIAVLTYWEIRDKRVGLGTGTCVALISAVLKALTRGSKPSE
jgi:hypothetical protein